MEYNTPEYILDNQSEIEEKIGYHFSNHKKLLIQAFTRKSFAQENHGFEDNEVLEFYGDNLVNTIITNMLFKKYSKFPDSKNDFYFQPVLANKNEYFYSEKNEAELSKIRAQYINKSALSKCIEILGLDEFLLLGKSDVTNEVWKNEKVRCDLFEAIIGAIAVSSMKRNIPYTEDELDYEQIENSFISMWNMKDINENYMASLDEECEKLGLGEPKYTSDSYRNIIYNEKHQFHTNVYIYSNNRSRSKCIEGIGNTELLSKYNAAKNALSYLRKYQISNYLEDSTPETAVQTLNTIYLKKMISKPEYTFSCSPDEDGNQIWRCECYIDDYEEYDGYEEYGIGEEPTKAEAKQSAAYDMIQFIHNVIN